jgi:signal peptidase
MAVEQAAHPATQPLRIPIELGGRARGRVGVARLLSFLLLFGVVLLILVAIAGLVLGVWRFTVIDTGSMRPTLNPGDIAVLTSEPPADLRRGQIVAFHPPGEPHVTVVHRVFSVHRLQDGSAFQTKGDANNTTDAWHAHIVGDTVWHESLKVPRLGYLAVWSGQRPVRFGLLVAIVILLASTLLGSIWRSAPGRSFGPDGQRRAG